MSKLFKAFIASLMVVSMSAFGISAWAWDQQQTIPISTTITGSTSLTVSYLKTADGSASAISGLEFDPTAVAAVTTSAPWVVSKECLLVTYSSNYAWGIRIVTNNIELTASTDPVTDPISNYIAGNTISAGPDGLYGTADDVKSYSGLIAASDLDSGITGEDPTARAALAWQVDDEWSTDPVDYAPTSSLVALGTGHFINDTNVGDVWAPNFDDWNYISDKSDNGFSENIYTPGTTDLTYPIVAVGSAGSNGSLVPATGGNTTGNMPSITDNDIVIYIAAKFASTNWATPTAPVPYVLSPDTYSAKLYVELIHE